MRLLWVTEHFAGIGGSEYLMTCFSQALQQAGVEVMLLMPDWPHPSWRTVLEKYRISYRVADGEEDQTTRLMAHAHQLITETAPDLMLFLPLEQTFIRWMHQSEQPIPVVAWEPTDFANGCYWLDEDTAGALRKLKHLIVLSEEALHNARTHYAFSGQAAIVHNRVFPPGFRHQVREKNSVNLVCASRFSIEKGCDLLLCALHQLKRHNTKWHLTFYGEGEDLPRMQDVALMLDQTAQVTYAGTFAPVLETDQALKDADVGLLMSYFEGMPVTLMEYAARGIPVVATATSGARAVLGADYPHLAPIADTSGFATQLGMLLEDTATRRAASDDLFDRYRQGFGQDRSDLVLKEFLQQVVISKSPC
jgi:glycosyltransferase involved in cell wall biosynthesis